jgi:hydrogenase nickel incorporation protein HypB
MEIKILKNVMVKNDAQGTDNRQSFLKNRVLTVNILSSPGSGKTTLLENSLGDITSKHRAAVIEGDLFTSRDAERLSEFNIPITQINTEGGCHLDAKMINQAMSDFNLEELDLLIIENVGNLVCPASFDLGENIRVLLYAITEGADKPTKYANIFESANVVIINKIDLADACKIDLKATEEEIRSINPNCKILQIAATDKSTLKGWTDFLDEKINAIKAH